MGEIGIRRWTAAEAEVSAAVRLLFGALGSFPTTLEVSPRAPSSRRED